ncbi:AcrR family transcriptional regulator [Streptacidiphilus sp. MAP12-16]|uniref:TetR/AcrR family transcriptional regulator n=1 Tax=Streptacidiphilus sp. MAP12-16 TaxID=3156300 RepID=UPI0035161903
MNVETAQAGAPLTRVLDAAESLFYARGVQSVGMDEVRAASGVSLKRLYQLFPSKGDLVEAYLRRRDARWLDRLARYVDACESPQDRVLAVFDWLHLWFGEPDFRGCAFVNAFGELGATSAAVAEAVRDHKAAFRRYLADLVSAAGLPAALAGQLTLLAEGAMTSSAISGSTEPAGQARDAARVLIEAARSGASGSTGPEGR